ncbi:hypothetical protein MTO96_026066 [Rhipicephalus appendiculatus]
MSASQCTLLVVLVVLCYSAADAGPIIDPKVLLEVASHFDSSQLTPSCRKVYNKCKARIAPLVLQLEQLLHQAPVVLGLECVKRELQRGFPRHNMECVMNGDYKDGVECMEDPKLLELLGTEGCQGTPSANVGDIFRLSVELQHRNKRDSAEVGRFRKQEKAEPFDSFLTDLKTRAKDCNFQGQRDKMIRDQVIFGIHNEEVRMKLLELEDPTLEKVAKVCAVHESSAKQLKAFRQETSDLSQDADPLHAVKATKQKSVTKTPIAPTKVCWYC